MAEDGAFGSVSEPILPQAPRFVHARKRFRAGRKSAILPAMPTTTRDRLAHLLRIAACLLLLAAAAFALNGRVLGRELFPAPAPATAPAAAEAPAGGDALVIDSTGLAPDVRGYGGPVPVVVEVREGRVAGVAPKLPNDETPMFFGMLDEKGLWHAWDDLPVEAAVTARVDAVTSATYSSEAAIANVRAALREAAARSAPAAPDAPAAVPDAPAARSALPSLRLSAALAVLLAAAVLPLVFRSRALRTALLALDVAVLGLWNGLFLSTARLVGWAGSAPPSGAADLAAALLLLAMAFLYPLFGRPQHYCLHVCPFGAAQELAGRLPAPKPALPPRAVRALTAFRRGLWIALMLATLCCAWSRWMEWELFGAFAWRAVPALLLALAVACLVLAAFVPRPYCRFVCPTGTLLKLAEAKRSAPKK